MIPFLYILLWTQRSLQLSWLVNIKTEEKVEHFRWIMAIVDMWIEQLFTLLHKWIIITEAVFLLLKTPIRVLYKLSNMTHWNAHLILTESKQLVLTYITAFGFFIIHALGPNVVTGHGPCSDWVRLKNQTNKRRQREKESWKKVCTNLQTS